MSECDTLRREAVAPRRSSREEDSPVRGGGEADALSASKSASLPPSRSSGDGCRGMLRAAAIAAERRGRFAEGAVGIQSASRKSSTMSSCSSGGEASNEGSEAPRKLDGVARCSPAPSSLLAMLWLSSCERIGEGSRTRWSTGSVEARDGRGLNVERGVGGSQLACADLLSSSFSMVVCVVEVEGESGRVKGRLNRRAHVSGCARGAGEDWLPSRGAARCDKRSSCAGALTSARRRTACGATQQASKGES